MHAVIIMCVPRVPFPLWAKYLIAFSQFFISAFLPDILAFNYVREMRHVLYVRSSFIFSAAFVLVAHLIWPYQISGDSTMSRLTSISFCTKCERVRKDQCSPLCIKEEHVHKIDAFFRLRRCIETTIVDGQMQWRTATGILY